MRGRRPVLIVAAGLALAACGSTASPDADAPPPNTSGPDTDGPDDAPSPGRTEAPAVTPAEERDAPTTPSVEPSDGGPVTTDDRAPAATSGTATPDEPPDEPVVGAEPGVPWPDEACSADNSPTTVAPLDGAPPSLALRPESVGNRLPDLAVRRINCGPGWVNLKNELPADRPLLVWFWAPH